MADILSQTTFNTTYKDDFKDSDNYHRILFNAGKALQARELTQMQTITQKEISRFGNNIFNEGSVVRAGNVTLDTRYEFVKITSIPAGYVGSDYVGKTLTADNGVVVKVLQYISSPSDAFYVEYLNTTSGTSSAVPIRVSASSVLSGTGVDDVTVPGTGTVVGAGTRISVDNGDYFVQGRFVFVEKQTIFVDNFSNTPNETIGFKLVEDIVTISDDTDLYDNQGAVPNISAPGADRYRIRLTLSKLSDLASDDNFVYLCRIENGVIVDQSTYEDAYNKINDVLAIRTKEESGDYVVSPFTAKFNTLDDSNLQLEVSAGVAYVDGYRLDIPSTKITVPKAQDLQDSLNQTVIAQYGNFLVGNSSNNAGLPNIDSCQLVNLKDAVNHGGTTLGTARVRAIEENNDGNYKFSLFDISLDSSGARLSDVRSFGTTTADYVNVVLDGGDAVLKNTSNNSLLFPLPQTRPQTVTIGTLDVQRKFTIQSNGSGVATANAAASPYNATGNGGTFINDNDWIISAPDSAIITGWSAGTLTSSVTISSLPNNLNPLELVAYVRLDNPTHSTKTLNTGVAVTKAWPTDAESDGNGLQWIQLTHPDIFKVNHIRQGGATGADLSSNFDVDNGQRDNFYARGRIIAKPGATIPTANIYVNYDHFSITDKKHFFSVNSYSIPYEDIPSYTKNNNETVSLRDVLDFRPYENATGGYDFSGVHALPQSRDGVSGGINYYLPRKDRLVASVTRSRDSRVGKGSLKVIRGVPDVNPQLPPVPTSSMPLYDISLNAFTLNDSDVTTSFYDNKRFTMKDIAGLERRIDDLYELTTLSLLEANTSTFSVVDSAGNPRTKAGFLADGFSNYAFSATDRPEYRAEVDPVERTLSPEVFANHTRLFYDSSVSVTTKVDHKGDLLLLPISSNVSFIDQGLATETMNVNPYHVITQSGITRLSPETDTWVETRFAPNRVIDGGTVTRDVGGTRRVRNLNTWRNSWFGQPQGDTVRVITGSRTIRRIVGERVLDVEVIPFMRSVKVYFKSDGLRPNTQHFPFFGGSRISDYAREENFRRISTDNSTQVYTNRRSHPAGSTDLISDSNGTIAGSFIIPSNNSLKFRTGTQQFKLLDITADNEEAALSFTRKNFSSQGTLETRQRTIRSTRQLDIGTLVRQERGGGEGRDAGDNTDPVAQTFRVDQVQNPNGLFVTKVRIYFSTISSTNPVFVQLRTVENGIPTSDAIPGAESILTAAEVASQWTSAGTTIATVKANSAVDFEFEEPVFLNSGQEYAIVVLTESVDYNVFVAKTYEFLLGSTEARVSKQPTLGSLFKSQNARTWTPDQERDLMFNIFRADFASSAQAVLQNPSLPTVLLNSNPLLTTSTSRRVRVFNEGHGLSLGDKVTISGLTASDSYGGILGSDINGNRTVENVDFTGFTFDADSVANSSVRVGGDSVETTQNMVFNTYFPSVQALLPEQTTLSSSVKLTGDIDAGLSYSAVSTRGRNEAISLSKDAAFAAITLNEFNTTSVPKIILSDSNEAGTKSFELKLDLSTTDTKVSPIIDLQRASVTTFENIIDRQDSSATDGFNVPLSIVQETNASGGTHAAKHITVPVTLEEPAVGLKILLAANRPDAANFDVYFKTAAGDETLNDKPYVLVAKEAELPADNDGTTFREYEYLAGGQVGNLSPFTQFQVKVVMTSTNSSQIPRIRDLRTIAMVT